MKRFVAQLMLSLLPILAGCGASLPTEQDGEQFLRQELTKGKTPIKLVSFHKTNGKGSDQSYFIEFDATIEFTANGRWRGSDRIFYTDEDLVANNQEPSLFTVVKAGQKQRLSGSVELEKTEKGWRGTGVLNR